MEEAYSLIDSFGFFTILYFLFGGKADVKKTLALCWTVLIVLFLYLK